MIRRKRPYRRLALKIAPDAIGWTLMNATPPPHALTRAAIDGDPIEALLEKAAQGRAAGARSIFLYRYSRETFGMRRNGMTFHEHEALIPRAVIALHDAGYTVDFEDV